jgi:YD repeat-containing protein
VDKIRGLLCAAVAVVLVVPLLSTAAQAAPIVTRHAAELYGTHSGYGYAGIAHNTYDAAGRLTAAADPLGQTVRYVYDATGNVTTVTDRAGC